MGLWIGLKCERPCSSKLMSETLVQFSMFHTAVPASETGQQTPMGAQVSLEACQWQDRVALQGFKWFIWHKAHGAVARNRRIPYHRTCVTQQRRFDFSDCVGVLLSMFRSVIRFSVFRFCHCFSVVSLLLFLCYCCLFCFCLLLFLALDLGNYMSELCNCRAAAIRLSGSNGND